MSTEPAPSSVTHNTTEHHFEIAIGDDVARLNYSMSAALMIITHTYVPPALRGQNIAGQLAKAAFDFARTEGLKVVPQCSYIDVYAKRHPEAAVLLA